MLHLSLIYFLSYYTGKVWLCGDLKVCMNKNDQGHQAIQWIFTQPPSQK